MTVTATVQQSGSSSTLPLLQGIQPEANIVTLNCCCVQVIHRLRSGRFAPGFLASAASRTKQENVQVRNSFQIRCTNPAMHHAWHT
jgi:hypothetical protein